MVSPTGPNRILEEIFQFRKMNHFPATFKISVKNSVNKTEEQYSFGCSVAGMKTSHC